HLRYFFFQAEDGIRDFHVTGVQTCALPIFLALSKAVAQHYLAEMYIWEGNPQQAIVEAQKVLNNTNYSLITDRYGVRANEPGVPFMDQFIQGNILPSEGNTEALWVLPNTDILESTGISRNSMRRTWVVNYASSGYADYSPEYGGRGLGSAAITAWGFSIYEPSEIGRASGRARGEGALVDEAVA